MKQHSAKTIETDEGDAFHRFTYVTNRRVMVNEDGLRKVLGDHVFERYTKRAFDRAAMERAIDNGEIDPSTIAPFVEYADSAPFVKFTVVKKEPLE